MTDRSADKVLDDIKVLSEKARVKAKLASMEARDLWNEELEPKIQQFEKDFDDSTRDSPIVEEVIGLEKKIMTFLSDLVDSPDASNQ